MTVTATLRSHLQEFRSEETPSAPRPLRTHHDRTPGTQPLGEIDPPREPNPAPNWASWHTTVPWAAPQGDRPGLPWSSWPGAMFGVCGGGCDALGVCGRRTPTCWGRGCRS